MRLFSHNPNLMDPSRDTCAAPLSGNSSTCAAAMFLYTGKCSATAARFDGLSREEQFQHVAQDVEGDGEDCFDGICGEDADCRIGCTLAKEESEECS